MKSSRPPLAVVTGAARGIGHELARQFAEHDFRVLAVADEPGITATRLGPRVEAVRLDLRQPGNVEALAARATELGVPAALAINTGTALTDHLAMVDLDVRATVHLAKLLVPGMIDRAYGRVLFTSPTPAPGPHQSVHNATTAFTHSYALSLREELRGTGVTVTALGPTDALVEDSAAAAFAAAMRGRPHVTPASPANRLAAAAARLLPDNVLTAVHRVLAKPA
ncbi:SDR family NAD(P)-dependent oxidoreductase [Actinokineospora auranticolor]|uniref:Short-subunit dehydrogenase n=1 Tax=Actinokineospora auranticolor TaxID=155976 RepID=A0A2S6GD98_9PSEU|nr:SDR family NAD(P)-dependent oxidoreductase [Actinokineospora auranticolor]PPK63091.1 short-subunit dehydrogenase [Actinokineospora auranticolor]